MLHVIYCRHGVYNKNAEVLLRKDVQFTDVMKFSLKLRKEEKNSYHYQQQCWCRSAVLSGRCHQHQMAHNLFLEAPEK